MDDEDFEMSISLENPINSNNHLIPNSDIDISKYDIINKQILKNLGKPDKKGN